jgi:adenylate cyclase
MAGSRSKLRDRAIDAALDVVPGDVVERVAAVTAPLVRHSGRTRVSAAALRAALRALVQPPRTRRRASGAMSLDEIAASVERSTQDAERWAQAGLLGPPAEGGEGWPPRAADRAALIAYTERRGVPEAEVIEATRRGRLPLLLLDHLTAREAIWTGRELAERAGLPLAEAAAFWRALGFPADDLDQRYFNRQDLEALRVMAALRTIFELEDLIEAASVTGRAMSEISAALIELFQRRVVRPVISADGPGLDASLRLAATSELLLSPMGPMLETALRHHLGVATRNEAAISIEETTGPVTGERELAVAFADLVDFTSLSEGLSALEVGQMASLLLHTAEQALGGHSARLVKSIGDAVMFTAPDAVSCCAAAVQLVEAAAAEPRLPAVRAGVAHGPVIRAYADYFGRTVNIASRLCDVAAAQSVLLHQGNGTAEPERWQAAGLEIVPRGERQLKGISGPVATVEVRRREAATARAAIPHAPEGAATENAPAR